MACRRSGSLPRSPRILPEASFFQQASDLHYPEAIIQQWNLTIERDLRFNTGLRLSYDGNHYSNMGVQRPTLWDMPRPRRC